MQTDSMRLMKGTLRIGTSGIVLAGSKKTFPIEFQSGTRLSYYSALFNTLEINSTFYKLPLASTFEKWASEVDENFRFTCKLPRIITHVKALLYLPEDIDKFMKVSNGIGEKKGCLLVQFPASIKEERNIQVEEILKRLTELNDKPRWKICVEFRDTSWYRNDSMLKKLHDLNVSVVLHDMPASQTPTCNAGSPVYLRFHGPTGDYNGSYSNEFLESYSLKIIDWLNSGREVYVYFNNTIGEALKMPSF